MCRLHHKETERDACGHAHIVTRRWVTECLWACSDCTVKMTMGHVQFVSQIWLTGSPLGTLILSHKVQA